MTFIIPPGTKQRTVSVLSHLGSLPCSTVCLKPDKLSIDHSLAHLHGIDGKDAGTVTESTPAAIATGWKCEDGSQVGAGCGCAHL